MEDDGSVSFKSIQNAKGNFSTCKSKYEKQIKETEQLIEELHKCRGEAKTYYNAPFMEKLNSDVLKNIRDIRNREKNLRTSIEEANSNQ